MKDYGISVLTQYQMEVFGTHKVRGAILVCAPWARSNG